MRKPAPAARPRSRATPRPSVPDMGETEFHLQAAGLLRLGVPPGGFWFHVPNQGKRSKATAGLFKGMGLLAGVTDIVLVAGPVMTGADGSVAFLELKRPNGKGRLREGQAEFRDMCQALGIAWAEVSSLKGVETFARAFYARHGLTFRATAQ